MEEREPAYSTVTMTKEQFFYAYKQLAQNDDCHLLLESGTGRKTMYRWNRSTCDTSCGERGTRYKSHGVMDLKRLERRTA